MSTATLSHTPRPGIITSLDGRKAICAKCPKPVARIETLRGSHREHWRHTVRATA